MKICGIFDEEEFELTEEVGRDQERLRIYLFIKDLVSCRYLTTCFYFNTRKRKWKDFMKISTERFVLSNCSSAFPMRETGCSTDPQVLFRDTSSLPVRNPDPRIYQVLFRDASSLPVRNPGPVLGVRQQSQR